MAAKPSRDITFSTDEQACRTLILDLGDGPAKKPLVPDEEATVVLDLTPTQVSDMLAKADAPSRKPAAK